MPLHSTNGGSGAEAPKTFLVGSVQDTEKFINCCPTASSLICTHLETGLDAIIAIPCRRWGCRHCGQRKAFGLAIRCELAKPERFITLTVDPKRWITPRDAYDGTRRKLSDFNKAIKKQLGKFEYLRVLEVTKKGWPHYHLLARCPYIPQDVISRVWGEMTGARICDVRKIHEGVNVFKYVLKYLCKQTYLPWTNRRVSWSRGFFPKPESSEPRQNPFVNRKRSRMHPADALTMMHSGMTIEQQRPGVWIILDSHNWSQLGPNKAYSEAEWRNKKKTPPS